ncbi:MAG: response regulator transcription factor [Pedobacter sp.]|nr:MAG: response regulator transcription factor [Pedobacter sp.]
MINAIIIDDEQHCIDRLQNLISLYCNDEVQIVNTYTNVEDAIEGLKMESPDLIFLDIQINNRTGFELLEETKNRSFNVVFTTAFEQYALKAFKFSAADYLLKPIDLDDLRETIGRLKDGQKKGNASENIEVLMQNMRQFQNQMKKITVPTVNGLVFIPVQDIFHCKSDINYTTLFLKDGKRLMVAKTLKEFEGLLSYYDFFRIHNSHLINLAYLKNYNKGKGGFVTLEDGTELEVSSRRKDDFLKRLAEL